MCNLGLFSPYLPLCMCLWMRAGVREPSKVIALRENHPASKETVEIR